MSAIPFVCSCPKHCRDRAEMRIAHGTPEEFTAAVYRALGEISVEESNVAISRYEREWAAAPENHTPPPSQYPQVGLSEKEDE